MKLTPFISNEQDCRLVSEFYSSAEMLRIELGNVSKLAPHINEPKNLWIDSGFDGYQHVLDSDDVRETWKKLFQKFRHCDSFGIKSFIKKPDSKKVSEFVTDLLDECMASKPAAISVPQLPHVSDVSRNKLNWALAKAAGKWKVNSKYSGYLILPVILTHQNQLNLKAGRNPRIFAASKSFAHSNADGYWIVDSTMADLEGRPVFSSKRFEGILKFHEEMKEKIPNSKFRIAGPYWGLNLISWARGSITHPAAGVGRTFQYHISGGKGWTPKTRIAIPSLRRWAIHGDSLRDWLTENVANYDKKSNSHKSLKAILDDFDNIGTQTTSRRQVAKFYSEWFASLEDADPASRQLVLFQDFSSAYVLGKTLTTLPSNEQPKQPERVPKSFMMFCL